MVSVTALTVAVVAVAEVKFPTARHSNAPFLFVWNFPVIIFNFILIMVFSSTSFIGKTFDKAGNCIIFSFQEPWIIMHNSKKITAQPKVKSGHIKCKKVLYYVWVALKALPLLSAMSKVSRYASSNFHN